MTASASSRRSRESVAIYTSEPVIGGEHLCEGVMRGLYDGGRGTESAGGCDARRDDRTEFAACVAVAAVGCPDDLDRGRYCDPAERVGDRTDRADGAFDAKVAVDVGSVGEAPGIGC